MEDEFRRIMEKARQIVEEAEKKDNDKDKVKLLSSKFRFDKRDSKNILKLIKNLR